MAGRRGHRPPPGSRRPQHTETVAEYERRQARDRVLGTAGLAVFGVVVLVNLVMEFVPQLVLLPGGHSELYFMGGLFGFGWALWVRFDLGLDRRQRR